MFTKTGLPRVAVAVYSLISASQVKAYVIQSLDKCCPCPSANISGYDTLTVTITQPAGTTEPAAVNPSFGSQNLDVTAAIEQTVIRELTTTIYVSYSEPQNASVVSGSSPLPSMTSTAGPGPSLADTSAPFDGSGNMQQQSKSSIAPLEPSSSTTLNYTTSRIKPEDWEGPASMTVSTSAEHSTEYRSHPSVIISTKSAYESRQNETSEVGMVSSALSVSTRAHNEVPATTITSPLAYSTFPTAPTGNSVCTITMTQLSDLKGDDVDIVIIDINTGESTCRKKNSGKPCNFTHGSCGCIE